MAIDVVIEQTSVEVVIQDIDPIDVVIEEGIEGRPGPEGKPGKDGAAAIPAVLDGGNF